MQAAIKDGKERSNSFFQSLQATRDNKAISMLWKAREVSNELKGQLDLKLCGILPNPNEGEQDLIRT